MLGWLYRLLIGDFHKHKWEWLKTKATYDPTLGMELPIYQTVIYKCKHCGKYRMQKIK